MRVILVRGLVGSLSSTTPGLLGCSALCKSAYFECVFHHIGTVTPCSWRSIFEVGEGFLTASKEHLLYQAGGLWIDRLAERESDPLHAVGRRRSVFEDRTVNSRRAEKAHLIRPEGLHRPTRTQCEHARPTRSCWATTFVCGRQNNQLEILGGEAPSPRSSLSSSQ